MCYRMKLTNKFINIFLVLINILLILFLEIYHGTNDMYIMRFLCPISTIITLWSVFISYKIYHLIPDEKFVKWLYFINISICISNICWYAAVFFINPFNLKVVVLFLDMLFYNMSCLLIIYYIWTSADLKILFTPKFKFLRVVIVFVIFGVAIFLGAAIVLSVKNNYLLASITMITVIISAFCMYAILFGFIFSKYHAIQIFFLGFLFLLNTIFVEISSLTIHQLFHWGQFSWYIGVCCIAIGIYQIYFEVKMTKNARLLEFRNRIREVFMVRAILLFIILVVILFVLLYMSHIINANALFFTPAGVILFSIIVLLLINKMFESLESDFYNIAALISGFENNRNFYKKFQFNTDDFTELKLFIIDSIENMISSNKEKIKLQAKNYNQEVQLIQKNNKYKELLVKKQFLEESSYQNQNFKDTVSELIHDIKSPTTIINHIVEQNKTTLNKADLKALKYANAQVLSLAHGLLLQYKNDKNENHQLYFNLFLLLEKLFLEFQAAYKEINFDFVCDEKFIFIYGVYNTFERAIINIMDNAVHAVKDKLDARIIITTEKNNTEVSISIHDNGNGMPNEIINKFINNEVIKSAKKHGHGIGLTQIKNTIKNLSGYCKIMSTKNMGTNFTLFLPYTSTPTWLYDKILLRPNQIICILDDEEGIFNLWQQRLEQYVNLLKIDLLYFSNSEKLLNFINKISDKDKNDLLLFCDFDIKGDTNGIEIIKTFKIYHSILVTALSETNLIQKELSKLDIKLLNKQLIPYIQIEVEEIKHLDTQILWLDDQRFFPEYIMEKFYPNKKFILYDNIEVFFKDIDSYNRNILVLLDFQLNTNMSGIDVAHAIHAMNFSTIVLLTAENEYLETPNYVRVINKNGVNLLKELDQLFNHC